MANVSDVTVLAAGPGPVVAIVKITSAHMLCPFVVVVSLHALEHGEGVIQKVRVERPHDYLKIIASSLPKQIDLSPEKTVGDLTDAELMAIVRGSKYLEPDPKGEQVA